LRRNISITGLVRYCEAEGRFPSDRTLCLYLNCSARQLRALRDAGEHAAFFEDVRLYAEEQLLQKGFEGKSAAFVSFLLKQEKYGGYNDKGDTPKDGVLRIELQDGDAALFE